jgi:hypothetical protein
MDFNTGTITVSLNYTRKILRYYSTRKSSLHSQTFNNSDASIPLLPSSYSVRLASRNTTGFLPFLLNHLRLLSQKTLSVDWNPHYIASERSQQKTPFPNNSSIVTEVRLPRRCTKQQFFYCWVPVHFHRNLFTEPLPSNERLLWLRYSGFQASCHNILNICRLLKIQYHEANNILNNLFSTALKTNLLMQACPCSCPQKWAATSRTLLRPYT